MVCLKCLARTQKIENLFPLSIKAVSPCVAFKESPLLFKWQALYNKEKLKVYILTLTCNAAPLLK